MARLEQDGTRRARCVWGIVLGVALSCAAIQACASDSGTNEPDDTDAGRDGAMWSPGAGGGQSQDGGGAGAPGAPGTGDCLDCHDVAWLEEQGIPPETYQ
jgi:hypothetical protein